MNNKFVYRVSNINTKDLWFFESYTDAKNFLKKTFQEKTGRKIVNAREFEEWLMSNNYELFSDIIIDD